MQSNLFVQNTTASKSTASSIKNNNSCQDVLEIEKLDFQLETYFSKKIIIDHNLNRQIVSFQGNKNKAQYRWFRYKEAFSADLVEYLIQLQNQSDVKNILDPFAGVGTTLFICNRLGISSHGIELLPVGQKVIQVRQLLNSFNNEDFLRLIFWKDNLPWKKSRQKKKLNQLPITEGAYPGLFHSKKI